MTEADAFALLAARFLKRTTQLSALTTAAIAVAEQHAAFERGEPAFLSAKVRELQQLVARQIAENFAEPGPESLP